MRPSAVPSEPDPSASHHWSHTARLTRVALKHRALFADHGAHAADDRCAAEDFVAGLQALGPACIKIGQTLSTRPDLLPSAYQHALEKLQDDVDPVPFEDIRRQVESDLGVRLTKAYAEFDPQPLASASLAQVHAAVLRDGSDVAVKVQRPGIAARIASDLATLARLAGLADRLTEQGRRVRFARWVAEMHGTLHEELDYRLEAENLRLFADRLAPHPTLVVPRVHDALSGARVLTMERIRGTKITQAVELRRLELPLDARAAELVRGYLDQVFLHGLVHADPHPGNVMLDAQGRVALLDLGMVARLGPRMRSMLLKLLCGAVDGDDEGVAAECAAMSERLGLYDDVQWRRSCSRLIGRYATQHDDGSLSAGRLLVELVRLAVDAGLRPPPEVALLGKTLMNLEAVARVLDPHLPMKEIVREHMATLVRGRIGEAFRPTQLMRQSVDALDLAQGLPRQVHEILDTLARNRLRIRVAGLEESRLLENVQKIANRIAAGIVTAGLIVGAAIALRSDASTRLWGYPALALVLFLIAFALGAGVVASALLTDRRMSPYRTRKP